MTTRDEVLNLAALRPTRAGQDLLLAYECWFRQRGDRQAARFWNGGDRVFAELAAQNYDDASTLRAAAHEKARVLATRSAPVVRVGSHITIRSSDHAHLDRGSRP